MASIMLLSFGAEDNTVKRTKKTGLNRETVRHLGTEELGRIAGGPLGTGGATCGGITADGCHLTYASTCYRTCESFYCTNGGAC